MSSTKNPEKVIRFLSEDAFVRASAVKATQLIEEMRITLGTYPVVSVAAGRAMVGAVLMASHLKDGQSVGLYFRGSGPIGSLFAESSYEGRSRASVANPKLDLPLVDGKLDVSGAIGHGLLEVVRGIPHAKQLYSGTVIIKTGEIGDDIAFYLQQSHQIPSVVALGVQTDESGVIKCAGGVLIEVMPGAPETAITLIEEKVKKVDSISKMILSGATEEQMVNAFLSDFKMVKIAHNHDLKYECRCSMERVQRSLLLIGLEELDNMIADNEPIQVTCEFCNRIYTLDVEQLKSIRQQSFKNSLN